MLLTLSFLVIGLIFLILGIIRFRKTYADGWCVLAVIGGLLLIAGFSMGIASIDNHFRRKVELEEYENLKYQVESVERDYIVTDANLRQEVLEMNNRISKNKVYGNNIWVSSFHNPELGRCEKLTWKQRD